MNEEVKPNTAIIKEIAQEDRVLKPFEHTILFEYTSDLDGKVYAGTFTFKKITLGGMSKVGIYKAQRQAGFLDDQIDENTSYLNNCIAHLMVWFSGTQLPDWAKDFDKLHDAAIVIALYKEGASFEATFRRPLAERSGKAPADSGSTSPK